ncbi:MAG: M56 family metallopeptidase [Candidatus Sulfotelmatobacter sp.]
MTQINSVLGALVVSAVRALVLAGVAGLGLTMFRAKSTLVRLFIWRAVLLSALAMPFLGLVLPPLRIPAPEFLASPTIRPVKKPIPDWSLPLAASRSHQARSRTPASLPASAVSLKSPQPHPISDSLGSRPTPWNFLISAIYLIVTCIFLIRLVVGVAFTQRLIRTSQNITDPRLRKMLDSHAAASNSSQVRESVLISVPVTVGAFRSAVLFPLCWREWDDSQLNAVICHELSHVSRRDALVQFVSLLHRAIFWFSPLAWWLDRHLSTLAEEASDEAALFNGTDRNDYAKTLLGFFETLQTASERVWWQGVSIAQHGLPEQRLEKILAWRGSIHMKKSLVIAIVTFSIPAVYLVASVRPASQDQTATSTPQSQAAAEATMQTSAPSSTAPMVDSAPVGGLSTAEPASEGPVDPPRAADPSKGMYATGPVPPGAIAPIAPVASYAGQSYGRGYSYAYGDDDEDRFIIVSGKSDSFTMSGSTQDIHHVERLKKQIPGDFIWFQRDEKSYIIRDQATIDRARAFWAPQEELGKKQEALGKQQEALGKQQEELGKKMEQVKVNVPDMTAALDALKAKLQKLGPTATMDQIGDLQSEIGELQSKIGEIQSQAGEQQSKLGEEQGRLGEQQGKLGEQQGELGRRQGELAREASMKMEALLDEAIKNGKAQPEPDSSHGASL